MFAAEVDDDPVGTDHYSPHVVVQGAEYGFSWRDGVALEGFADEGVSARCVFVEVGVFTGQFSQAALEGLFVGPSPLNMDVQGSRQAQRSQRTRELLMDATLHVIADVGYARATSAQISEAAGVSRGAQTHHFRSKAELVLAALDRMAWRYERAARALLDSLPPANERCARW